MSDIKDAISIRYNNLVYELKEKGKDPIVLSLGESYFDIPTPKLNEASNPEIFHYSHSKGLTKLRHVLTEFYKKSYGVISSPDENIIISAGSKVLVYLAMKSILKEGDEIIIPEPAWVSYSEQAKLCGAKIKYIPIGTKISDYQKYISQESKILIVCNPHNPTGYNLSEDEIHSLYDFALENNLILFSDEAYSEFIPKNEKFFSMGRIDKDFKNSVVFNSMSKNIGVSGWRIGFAFSNKKTINEIYKLNQHIITCAPSLLEHYSSDNFDQLLSIARPQINDVVLKRSKVVDILENFGLKYEEGTSTFYFFVSIEDSGMTSVDFCDKLLSEYFVAAVPGIGYGPSCDGYIRLSFGTESLERISQGIELIARLVRSKT
tara:strand:+ start:11083 stop:12210 length:1128 start_codon:yes stop_codon:yes gene_type:complete